MSPVAVVVQSKPNFAGAWTLDPSRTDYSVAGLTVMMSITQDNDTLSQRLANQVLHFRLDGSETINVMKSSAGPVELKSRARWDGNKLVLQMDGPSSQGHSTQTLSLSVDGNELIVEMGGIGPKGERTGKAVFTRSARQREATPFDQGLGLYTYKSFKFTAQKP